MINNELLKEMQAQVDKQASLAKMQLQLQQDLVEKIYLQLAPLADWFKNCVTVASDKLGK